VREVLQGGGEPQKYRRRETQRFSKLASVLDRIREILKAAESAPPKQRHTAMRLFERLRDEYGYKGGYDTVCRFVKQHRGKQRETFIPLDHAHGQQMEADVGKSCVDFPEGRKQVSSPHGMREPFSRHRVECRSCFLLPQSVRTVCSKTGS